MKSTLLKTAAVLALVAFGATTNEAQAAFIVAATVGGAATGVNYVNFDNLPTGTAGGTSGGVGVSFAGGATVTGASDGFYAPPYISGSNGVPFGDNTVSGVDTTKYLTTGIGSATLTFPGMEKYLGLLWGSVDTYNKLQFFSGATLVGTLTGADIIASANGDQGVNGTYYANIVSSLSFDKIIASSTDYAFELDNVAYNPTAPVPEPFTLGLMGLGMVGIAGAARRRKTLAKKAV